MEASQHMTDTPTTLRHVIPKPGDFGVSHGGGLPMWFVRLGTFSRYGHAAVCVDVEDRPDGAPAVIIIEARPNGVARREARPGEFRWSTGGPLDADLTDKIRSGIIRTCYDTVGRGYDWPSIVGFLARFFGAKLKGHDPEHPDNKLFCSELVAWSYRVNGIDLFPDVAPGSVAPGDLVDYCPRSPGGVP